MPDQTVTLRPNGLYRSGGWVAVNGNTGSVSGTDGGAFVTYTADNDDATYIESPIGNTGGVDFFFTTALFPARSIIRSVTPVLRTAGIFEENGWNRISTRLALGAGTASDPDQNHPTVQNFDMSMALTTRRLGAVPKNHLGKPWTQNDIDRLRCRYRRLYDWDLDRPQFRALYLEVAYNEAPVGTLIGPEDEDAALAGIQVISTSMPVLTWGYSDPEGDFQERYHLYVYPQSVYSQPSFEVLPPDPVTNPSGENRPAGAVWEAGPVFTRDQYVKIDKPLPNGFYRGYLSVSDADSGARYSNISVVEWEQKVPPPPLPTAFTAEVQ
jgi:hypothetical protein